MTGRHCLAPDAARCGRQHSHTATGSPSVMMGVTSKSQNAVQVPSTTRAMLSCPARRGLASTHAQPAYAIQKVVKYCT